jgi:hypothetical protein
VLQTVATVAPVYGYSIAARLEQVSNGAIHLNIGRLYPGLMRLETKRADPWEMACDGEQLEGALFRDHSRRTPSPRGRAGILGTHGVHHVFAAE